MLLDANYFNDEVTHSPKEFWRRFRMKKDLFMKIIYGFKEYADYFMVKQDCTDLWGFTSKFRSALVQCVVLHMELLQIQPVTTYGWRSRHVHRLSAGFAEPS
ncbi:hypothetical protein QYE76_067552 [Lolium multiflorum]|uniref:Uncharacterized protein n=1 Tax=Lolium multiflorum TaxID=4521 RepID=A0AAD8SCT3_LOLMU|nr:hypothetical protein QYE76_067552 [Lolium multiflorum]